MTKHVFPNNLAFGSRCQLGDQPTSNCGYLRFYSNPEPGTVSFIPPYSSFIWAITIENGILSSKTGFNCHNPSGGFKRIVLNPHDSPGITTLCWLAQLRNTQAIMGLILKCNTKSERCFDRLVNLLLAVDGAWCELVIVTRFCWRELLFVVEGPLSFIALLSAMVA